MKPEEIKTRISYIETEKIKNVEATIAFYKDKGARKDLTDLYSELAGLNKQLADFKSLLENGPQKKTDLKVKVTAYNGNLVIETLEPEDFDEDFIPAGPGLIGCVLKNNSRLGISDEAMEIIKTYKMVRDVIGDLMGGEEDFSWIGPDMHTLRPESVVCRDFKLPKGYVSIPNYVKAGFKEFLDDKKEGSNDIRYEDFEQEIWIELNKRGGWKGPADKQVYTYNDYYSLENTEGARFVRGKVYDKEITILNVPDGMIKTYSDGSRKVMMSKEEHDEILRLVVNIFKKANESTWDIQVPDLEIMSYINPLFDLGFDNNVMNPRDGYWRMSITATPKVMIEKLRAFKKEETLVSA